MSGDLKALPSTTPAPHFLSQRPDVIDVLRAILSSLQRLEGSVRDLAQRATWQARPLPGPAANASAPWPTEPARSMPVKGDPAIAVTAKAKVKAITGTSQRSTVIPKGPKAVAAMIELRKSLGLSQGQMADAIGVTNAVIGFIETRRQGISRRVYEAMERLKTERS